MKISLPLTTALYVSSHNHAAHRKQSIQVPLRGHFAKYESISDGPSYNSPLTNLINMMHTTSMTVGDPPQAFSAMIDLSGTEFWVPSSKCTEGCKSVRKYHSAFSRTYRPNGTAVELHNSWVNSSGFRSKDTVQVAGVKIDHMLFEEATSLRYTGNDYYGLHFDTILGLAPYYEGSPKNELSPLAAMKSKGLLDQNLFSLRLSHGDIDGPGELTLGGVNEDLYSGDLVFMPATNSNNEWAKDKWQVELEGLYFGDGKRVRQTFDRHTAIFETDQPLIYVERHIADGINDLIGAEPIPFYYNSIPCERRSKLPDLTLTLNGQNFTISPYDYTLEVTIEKHGRRCISSFVGVMPPGSSFVVLGSAFLRSFVSVFNIDDKTVGLARAKHAYL